MTRRADSRRRQWAVAAALWIGLCGVYLSNGREIGASDTIPSVLLPISMLRGDGVRLDRFRHLWPNGLPYYVVDKGGAVVSRYPIGPPLLALPFAAPQLMLLDHRHPDWERDASSLLYWARKLGKGAAAALSACTAAVLYLLLCGLGLDAVALAATLIAALGSNLWVTGSQSLWQHGPAALALTTALALTVPPAPPRWRLLLAGAACAALVYCRPQDALFAMLILLGIAIRDGVRVAWCLPLPIVLGAALLAYNLAYFGRLLGGYGELLAVTKPASHGNTVLFGEDIPGAIIGTLLSPSRGLFVFAPWVPLTLLTLPAIWTELRRWVVLRLTLLGIPVFFFQVIYLSTWWAGWSFGPRYWTDVMPLFGILLAFALDWARRRSRLALVGLVVGSVAAIAVQSIGAFFYPSSFNAIPGSIDVQHERLWTWRDGEIARCLREGPHRWD